YSNLGYCVLGDVIAHVMHTTYPKAMARLLFGPLGMTRTTASLANPRDLLSGEVHYYGQGSEATGSQSPQALSLVAALGAAGIVSSAPDLERYLIMLGGAAPDYKPQPVPGGNKYIGIFGP